MPIKVERTKHKGAEYALNTLGAIEGLHVFGLLTKALAEPLGVIAKTWSSKKSLEGLDQESFLDSDVNPDSIQELATQALRAIGEKDVQEAVQTMLGTLHKDNRPVNFDSFFAGNYGPLVHLVPFAIKLNFASFLAENPGVGALVDKAASMTQANQT